jgi:glycosyltransferase involved in cell wall biosynthesis
MKILLTTPDYPPKLGGLSTFCRGIENVLKKMGHEVEVLQWNTISDIKNYTVNEQIDYIFNIHYQGGVFLKEVKQPQLNFIHGSEVFFTSPNWIKKLVKKFLKKKFINYFQSCKFNVFISGATQNILVNEGLNLDYARDIILHNGIDTSSAEFVEKQIGEEIVLCSFARDVPHKNLVKVVEFSQWLSKKSSKKVKLYLTSNRFKSEQIEIHDVSGISDERRSDIFKSAHFNLLFSKDHSHLGFIEGFGLTCLEAAIYGTPSLVHNSGGLPENVHHEYNGFVFNELSNAHYEQFYQSVMMDHRKYQSLAKNSYDHTLGSHGLHIYRDLFKRILTCQ